MKNMMRKIIQKAKTSHRCPHCHQKIGFLRKLLFFDGAHFKECPYCHRKIKIKTLNYLFAVFYAIIVIITVFLYRNYEFGTIVLIVVSIPVLIFAILANIFLPFIPSKEEDEQQAEDKPQNQ